MTSLLETARGNRRKMLIIIALCLVSGCALIDAFEDHDDDNNENNKNNNPIVINNGPGNNGPPPNNNFIPIECGYGPCFCGQTLSCDPKFHCPTFGCRTCTSNSHCESGDFCADDGLCNICHLTWINSPDYYTIFADGTEYVCETDPDVAAPVCFHSWCYPHSL